MIEGQKVFTVKKRPPVDTFPPNAFGLYDMHGNVWEWCLDHHHGSYEGAPADGSAWISDGDGDIDDTIRVVRGGSWNAFPNRCRSASRMLMRPYSRCCTIGFRVVCEIPRTP